MIEVIAVVAVCLCVIAEGICIINMKKFVEKQSNMTVGDISNEFRSRCYTIFCIPALTLVLEVILLFLKS